MNVRALCCRVVSLWCCVVLLVSGCATERRPQSFKVSDPHAEDQFDGVRGTSVTEVKYGNKIYLRIVASGAVCEDEKVVTYMQGLRERLAPYVERETLPYVITPINDTRIYAVSTPGGYIYISLGMLSYLETESALAFVIAHEMVQTQYKPQQFRMSKRLFGLFRGLVGCVKFLFPYTFGVSPGLKLVDRLVLKDISPEKSVMHADEQALMMLDKAGYRLDVYQEFIEAFSRFDAQNFLKLELYLQNRPITANRIEGLIKQSVGVTPDRTWLEREHESYARVRRYVAELLRIHSWSYR